MLRTLGSCGYIIHYCRVTDDAFFVEMFNMTCSGAFQLCLLLLYHLSKKTTTFVVQIKTGYLNLGERFLTASVLVMKSNSSSFAMIHF